MGITKDAISTVDGQTVNTMDTLNALAKKMGAETAFSAQECAEALNYLALAGYDTQQMCDTLLTVLNLAAAGDINLASASDMVTDAMSALGILANNGIEGAECGTHLRNIILSLQKGKFITAVKTITLVMFFALKFSKIA